MSEKMDTIYVYTDGGSRGNPGVAGAGVVITDEAGNVLKRASKSLGIQTNNHAEYQAVILALENLKRLVPESKRQETHIEMRMDSELIQRQLSGKYQIKEEGLCPLFMKIWNMRVADFPHITFTHIPREKNKEADQMANMAMDAATKAS